MDVFEMFDATERVIVSPAVGVYHPSDRDPATDVEAGEVIGHIAVAGQEPVPVRSPFDGRLLEVVAWRGERVLHRQRIAWLRVAA